MTSTCTPEFWARYNALPEEVRALALKNYQLWQENPQHPSLRFKHLEDGVWSVRIGIHYRALGEKKRRRHPLVLDRPSCRIRPSDALKLRLSFAGRQRGAIGRGQVVKGQTLLLGNLLRF